MNHALVRIWSLITQLPSSNPTPYSLSTNPPPTSTIYVQPTSRIHASRPAGFGPHFENPNGKLMNLLPIDFLGQKSYQYTQRTGCPPADLNIESAKLQNPPPNWIALVERGTCPFVEKIRYAQTLGASAVIIGDWDRQTLIRKTTSPVFYSSNPSLGSDQFGFGSGLVTMYAPGDTSDIEIPSVFVARDSYLSLRQDWLSLNPLGASDSSTIEKLNNRRLMGNHHNLEVIMSKDEIWTWPFIDLLIILLFLPSILTAMTLILHRINLFRKRRADRAPREFVDRLPCVVWAKDMEKGIPVMPSGEDSSTDPASATSESSCKTQTPDTQNSWLPLIRQKILTHFTRLYPQRFQQQPNFRHNTESTPLLGPHLRSTTTSSIPTVYFAQRECALCLSEFEVGDLIRILPCGHCFHQGEILNNCMGIDCWLLKSKRVCPICRMSITAAEEELHHPPPINSSSNLSSQPPQSSTHPVPIIPPSSNRRRLSLSAPILFGPSNHHQASASSPIPSSSSVTLDHQRRLSINHHHHQDRYQAL